MMKLSDISESALIALQDAQLLLRSHSDLALPKNMTEEQLMDEICRFVVASPFEIDVLNFKNFPVACGCMGPKENFTLCPCDIYGFLEHYRYDVAVRLR